MAIYKMTTNSLVALAETRLQAESVLERRDLQRLLRTQIEVLDPGLMVVSEEFSQWEDSGRRIDLLCIDQNANLVVVELKRTEDGGYMDLQAVRYAAMISTLSFSHLVGAYKSHLDGLGEPSESAEEDILGFLEWEQVDDERFANDVRIVLAAADFSKELTTSVLWLNEQGLDISCVRLKPYRDSDGQLFLDVQQIIPLPEAIDYQTQIKAKEQAGRAERAERHDLRFRFWTDLLKYAGTQTKLHAGRRASIYNWIGGSIGRQGFHLNYVVKERESRVELYIDQGPNSDESNLKAFEDLKGHRAQIETEFGAELEWQDLPGSRACRIARILPGGYRSPESEWPDIQRQLVQHMIDLDRVLRPYVSRLNGLRV